ncbi:type II toxin-antitoxin system PemK/MazF family toxin [Companilactobacillus halodurans]|uniref:Toxin-antitoxin system, toxin component, MazF family protein n=1 Tax=Companilactobacillus halodurans TaxID=2584183 RepID=A0A5P0ZTX3_9LACO|nr:type II toxin-antitoxin system PemK/MazF family toxin [Companilactobacillus halodurans]MQS76090.1 toxin-antitoxin system, toxin component, MazF family protein [Companilactobacillus halodurans]MQS96526.1 toxin-antitoxin system, toxin component, MazF family protein [Companilactobacillus halodurans]
MTNHKITKPDDILILYVSFIDSDSGKKRPILVVNSNEYSITFFSLTTKYEKKSNRIKKQYYKIKNWKKSGLLRQSYVDIGTLREISLEENINFYKLGELCIDDIVGLNKFINEFYIRKY